MGSLEGRVAWVTGGGSGIGRAAALALAARGVRVLVTGRTERALGMVVGEIANAAGKARHLVADARDPAQAKDAVAKAIGTWGALDIVIASAGQAARIEPGQDLARARELLETNVFGAYCTFDAALSAMKGPGRLLAISRPVGIPEAPGYAAYAASMAALHGLVRALAHDIAPRKITCNALCLDAVDTNLTDAMIRDLAQATGKSRDEAALHLFQKPGRDDARSARRLLDPEEVGQRIVSLCSSEADGITGQVVTGQPVKSVDPMPA